MTNVIQLSTSRRFLVTQAVLNAADKNLGFCVKKFGIAQVLRKILEGDDAIRAHFYMEARNEFLALVSTYREVPDHEVDDFAGTDPDLMAAVNGGFNQ